MGNCKSSSPADSAGGEAVKSGPKEVSCRVVLIDRHTDDHGAVMFQVSPAFDDVRVPATRSTRSGVIAALSQQHVDWEYSWQGQGPPPQHGSRWGRHCDCTPPAKSPRRLSLSPLKKRKSAASIEEEDDGPYPCQDPSMCLLRSNRAMNTSTPGAVWLKACVVVAGAALSPGMAVGAFNHKDAGCEKYVADNAPGVSTFMSEPDRPLALTDGCLVIFAATVSTGVVGI